MARPSKYTPARRAVVLRALKAGNTRTAAAAVAGVDGETVARWIERYADFSAAVTRAEDQAEAMYLAVLKKEATGYPVVERTETIDAEGVATIKTVRKRLHDWRAAESWLKRRRRDEWGDNVQAEHSGMIGLRAFDTIKVGNADNVAGEVATEEPVEDSGQGTASGLPSGPEAGMG
jgi:TPP-dependent trihydroxycyclohexane-1,2-dione (THcHDO) dehydratase